MKKRHAVLALLLASCVPVWAQAATPGVHVSGQVHGTVTTVDGSPVRGAHVTFAGSNALVRAVSGDDGGFSLDALIAGTYAVSVSANGYGGLTGRTIDVRAGVDTRISFALARSTSSLVTIGNVQANGGESLFGSSAPVSTIDPQAFAARAYTRVSDVLQTDVAATLVHPVGGGATLPVAVALRGPDPTETLIAIDGHQVNSANTGAFDLSLLDPADYGSIELIKGISPSGLVGPNTIDGAINIRLLEPTVAPRAALRLGAGSYATFLETLGASGTLGRLGYAASAHQTSSPGQVNQSVIDAASGDAANVGSAVEGKTFLGALHYAVGNTGAFAAFTLHDQSIYRDLSAGLSSIPTAGTPPAPDSGHANEVVNSFAGTTLLAHNSSYGLDVGGPLGHADATGASRLSALVRGFSSLVSQSISGPGADTSPYLYNDRDAVSEGSFSLNYQLARSSLILAYDVREEHLTTDFVSGVVNDQSIAHRTDGLATFPGTSASTAPALTAAPLPLEQTSRWALARYTIEPTAKLHYTIASYYSNYSTFGSSFDPRFGFVWTPAGDSALRFSIGTTFQAPQLPELYVPTALPPPSGGYVSVGNPHLKPDHATEYGAGFEHIFIGGARRTSLSLDLYRVNLRAPASLYLPPPVDGCGSGAASPRCPLSFPVNAANGVYQGFELAFNRRLATDVSLQAAYALHNAYVTGIPASIQNGTLVAGEQTLGLPLHKATVSIQDAPARGFNYGATLVYEGQYNELNQPPYATLAASLGYRWNHCELMLAGTNLTNVYAANFTRQGAGVSYAGADGPIATNAYALTATTVTLTIAYHN